MARRMALENVPAVWGLLPVLDMAAFALAALWIFLKEKSR